ncbi:putative RNA methyltransferase [Glaciihabitans sp. UYNi722]|uniref:putative RNA methyltransferase n=1 Tax=Glaciihabitans sp. UYNi722 TaxID=3156344 RepID=UPI003396E577
MTTPTALNSALPYLACPICESPLIMDAAALTCERNHTFNIARQGYASLLVGGHSPHLGDTTDMVRARQAFLAAGHYRPIADAVAEAIPGDSRGLCVDLAGGTGYYLERVLELQPSLDGLVLDASVAAVKVAARSHPRIAAASADAWRALPVRSGAVGHILNVFGPRNGPEMRRILEQGGTALIVTPRPSHLEQLRERLGMIGIQDAKEDRLDAQLAGLTLAARRTVEYTAAISPSDVFNEVSMGPSAFHVKPAELEARVQQLEPETMVTIAVSVSTYRKS